MKKCITWIVMVAIAGVVSAQVVIEDWEGGATLTNDEYRTDDETGWGGNYADSRWEIVAATSGTEGTVLRYNSNAGTGQSIWLDVSSLGLTAGTDYQLQFTVRGDAGHSGGVFIYSVGQNNAATTGDGARVRNHWNPATNILLPLDGATAMVDRVDFTSSIVAESWETITSATFQFSETSSHIFIGFGADGVSTPDRIEIGTVSIIGGAPAAQPGTLFVLK